MVSFETFARAASHVRALWRLGRRQENPAARKQANLQRSDHRSLLFIAHYFFCSVMRL